MITFLGQVIIGLKLSRIKRRLNRLRNHRKVVYRNLVSCGQHVNTHRLMNPFYVPTPQEQGYKALRKQYVNLGQDIRDLVDDQRDLRAALPSRRSSSQLVPTP